MVAMLGTNQAHVFSLVFMAGCFLAGIAGGFAAAFESINYLLDTRVIVLAFIVVVIGGLGNFYGALFAALAVGILKAIGLLYAPRLSMVIIFLLMAVVLLIRSLRRSSD
jgi:branched-subunit amino acid ABC-type transport system permease component